MGVSIASLVSFFYKLILFGGWISSVAIYFEIDYQYIVFIYVRSPGDSTDVLHTEAL